MNHSIIMSLPPHAPYHGPESFALCIQHRDLGGLNALVQFAELGARRLQFLLGAQQHVNVGDLELRPRARARVCVMRRIEYSVVQGDMG